MARVVLNQYEKDALKDADKVTKCEKLLKKFRKAVERDDIIYEVQRREFFSNKSLKRAEKSKRNKIRLLKEAKKKEKLMSRYDTDKYSDKKF